MIRYTECFSPTFSSEKISKSHIEMRRKDTYFQAPEKKTDSKSYSVANYCQLFFFYPGEVAEQWHE